MIVWRNWAALALSGGLAVGCSGSSDPGVGATASGSSSGSGDGSTGLATTSITASGGSTSTTDALDDSSSTTADGSSSSSSSSGASSSSSGPGCELGTLDCACDDGACLDDLVCTTDDVCDTPPNCPQERSEPNNVEAEAPDLGDFDDFDPTFETVDGRLPSADDVDWFSYHCDDNAVGQVDMNYEMDTNIPVRVCQFIACDDANNPTVACPDNAEPATSPDGLLPGCCSTQTELAVPDIDCNPGNDDSGVIFVSVDMPLQDMCVSYDLGVHC